MTESDVINAIAYYGDHVRRYELMIPNCYTQADNEADLFAVRKSGLCDEFEVKISRSDFFNDAKKVVNVRDSDAYHEDRPHWLEDLAFQQQHPRYWLDKKLIAPWQKQKYDALGSGAMCTNYFWYVVPEGLIDVSEIPKWAGLIYVRDGRISRIIKSPDKLHPRKLKDGEKYQFARKIQYRYWDLNKKTGH